MGVVGGDGEGVGEESGEKDIEEERQRRQRKRCKGSEKCFLAWCSGAWVVGQKGTPLLLPFPSLVPG